MQDRSRHIQVRLGLFMCVLKELQFQSTFLETVSQCLEPAKMLLTVHTRYTHLHTVCKRLYIVL